MHGATIKIIYLFVSGKFFLSVECACVHVMQFMATTGWIMVMYVYTFHCYLGFQSQTEWMNDKSIDVGMEKEIVLECNYSRRSQWPRGLRRGSAAAPLLGLWVWIPAGGIDVCHLSVVYCQVEASATSWSLVQRSSTECGVSECDHESSIMRPWPTGGCCAMVKKNYSCYFHMLVFNVEV